MKQYQQGWKTLIAAAMCALVYAPVQAQIHASFQTDVQRYYPDSAIGAGAVNEKILSNTFLQVTYQKDRFSAGVRYEAYLNPLLGFDNRYEGQGLPYKFVHYQDDKLEITAGNIYEQFGSGLTLRTYQEWALGIDNSIDGVRARFTPFKGVTVKGIMGKQRAFWDKSQGLIRGADAEISFNDLISGIFPKFDTLVTTRVTLGGSLTNRFLADDDPVRNLPDNVTAAAGRVLVSGDMFSLNAEYAYRINDPMKLNKYTYNPGNALYVNASFFKGNFSANLMGRRIDNFDFRSGRDASLQEMTLSYLPACTRQHTWRLITLYPYATQLNGELGGQLELAYTFPKKTPIGGPYGMTVTFNASHAYGLDTTTKAGLPLNYEAKPFIKNGENPLYFRDYNLEVYRKWNKRFKSTFAYIHILYNKRQIEGTYDIMIRTHALVAEGTYKLTDKGTLRMEAQAMLNSNGNFNAKVMDAFGKNAALAPPADRDKGNWYMLLAEYTHAPHWSVSAWTEYNTGFTASKDPNYRKHHWYPNCQLAHVWGGNRIAIGYGKQRAGLLCVGGICRVVPASNGFNLSIMSTF